MYLGEVAMFLENRGVDYVVSRMRGLPISYHTIKAALHCLPAKIKA